MIKIKILNPTAVLVLALTIPVILSCNRDNPFDSKSGNFVPGKKPVAVFLHKSLSAFLDDSISISIVWSDTTVGGVKGAIREFYFDWSGNAQFEDSVPGTQADTFVIKKAFHPGNVTGRTMAVAFDGNYSDVDTIKLTIRKSMPHIITVKAPLKIEKMVTCTVSATADDSGGKIQSFLWAKNGNTFDDTTAAGIFRISFSDTGKKMILTKVRDNKAIESPVDTVRISVYENLYTTFYDGNGNTGGTSPTDPNGYANGQSVTVLGNSGGLVKAGYVFAGWNTKMNGSGATYSVGATFVMGSANVTVYAKWALNPTYTVSYDGNGSTGGTVPLDSGQYSLGQTVTTQDNAGSLVKTGFTFVGWNTQAGGSGISYAIGISFTMGSTNVALYAQWTANPTFAVMYDGNGNTGGTVPVDNNNYQAGVTVTVLGNAGSLVKTGFTFVGWNTVATGTGTSYATGVTFPIGAANAVLYAQWTANPTYTVTYNGNGSTSGSAPTDVNSYVQGQVVTTRNVGSLARAGYAFTGWNTSAGGSQTAYSAGVTFSMGSANVVLYAQWALIPTYTVTYNGNGNTGGTVPLEAGHYSLGQTVTTRNNTGSLVKTGFTFVGWNTLANGTGISYAAGVDFVMGPADVVLYARWTANPAFIVTYDGNGNTGGTVPADANNYATGASVTTLGPGSLVKTGFAFAGWNTVATGTGTGYAAGATFAMGSEGVTLYAQWTVPPTYTVTYIGNGNTGGTAPTDSTHYTQGQTVTIKANTGSLVKTGSTFIGWNTKKNGSGTGYTVGATFAMGSANVTLYAKWQ